MISYNLMLFIIWAILFITKLYKFVANAPK